MSLAPTARTIREELETVLVCRPRRNKPVTLDACLEGYLDANAFEIRSRLCYRCPVGRQRRDDFSRGREPR